MSDYDNRDTLLEISSFVSTHSDTEPTTLAEYVSRMKEGQEQRRSARPPSCCTARRCWPKAASSTIRPGSPRCSRTV